ncbi:MAG TPA: glutaminase A [Myxococcota bacterium]|nr:glutaminase A [Myxococcota bacterium]
MTLAPDVSPVARYLHELHERFRHLDEGEVATYIPELSKADPSWFGICIATVDGHVYEVGQSRQPFTIQSISKPFVYGLALEDRGKPAVLERIGVEPTGDAFNEISLEPGTGRPLNPMINAGAITASSLVSGHSAEDQWERILGLFALYTGRRLLLDEDVYRSERETGHRNRAISHMLRNFGILGEDPERAVDLYFRQCSIEVTCRDLSVMAATLATGGTNPVTRERAIDASNVDEVLSVMTTCGMYDYAGEWVYRVGFPAKSGVSGGILAVLPGQLGIGVYSPRLDARGNSVRGVAVCSALSDELELHSLRAPRASQSVVRSRFTLKELGSKRMRLDHEREILSAIGRRVVAYEIQGDLGFAGMELVTRRLTDEPREVHSVIVDLGRATEIDATAARLLLDVVRSFSAQQRTLALVGLDRHPRLRRFLDEARGEADALRFAHFEELDLALEWGEERLLEDRSASARDAEELALSKHAFFQGLDADEIEQLAGLMERREFPAKQFVVRKGDPADALYLLVRGRLSVLADDPRGRLRRLATLSPGMGFGEPAIVETGARSAFVRADHASVCWVLKNAAVHSLEASTPKLKIRLLENLLRSSWRIVDRLTHEAVSNQL